MKSVALALVLIVVPAGCAPPATPTATPPQYQHFTKSIELNNQAARIVSGSQSRAVPKEDMKAFIDLARQALAEAKFVDIEQLNRDYRELGTHYRDEFMSGLALLLEGYDTRDIKKVTEAQILSDRWFAWYGQRVEDIRRSVR